MFDVTIQDMCTPGYSKKVRAVPRALRIQVYRKYGITSSNPGDYQLDHLIPLSLGGSNSIRNLWPQSYNTSPWNAYVKHTLEDAISYLKVVNRSETNTSGFGRLRSLSPRNERAMFEANLYCEIKSGLEHGGFVPRGRRAEDGRNPDHYKLTEVSSVSYAVRTKRNVRETDGTVVFSLDPILTGGSSLTFDYAAPR